MTHAQQKQLVRGAVFLSFGLFFAGYAIARLEIGTPRAMGAGMFPMIVGFVVAAFGLAFAVPTLLQVAAGRAQNGPDSRWEQVDWRGAASVTAALAVFAAIVGDFGLVPATFAMMAVAAFANRKTTPLLVVLLSVGFLTTTYLIFILGLKLPLQLWGLAVLMDILAYLSTIPANAQIGLAQAVTPVNLFYCAIGVTVGTLLGALPGLGTFIAMALLFPLTFHLEPTTGLIMLGGIYYGTSYGGSIASILLNIPGEAKSALACIDGYPMARQGRAGVALSMTAVGSFIGGSIGIVVMMLFAPMIAQWALKFGPASFFALMLLGLVVASSASSSESPMSGYAMVALGIAMGLVGTDLESNVQRYTFGIINIWDGLSLTALAIGLFGVAEVIATMKQDQTATIDGKSVTLRALVPTADDTRRTVASSLRGGIIGATTGSIPGTGGLIAAFISYAVEKKVAKDPSRFGKGAIEGVTGPESANNAADQAAFIPTLSLGIPGTPALALLLGVLLIHGMTPGPSFVNDRPEMFWGLVMSFWVGNIFLLILNIPLVGVWVRILTVPQHILYPAVLFFIAIGAYSVNTSAFDVGEVVVFGIVGYWLRLLDMPLAPLILGFILGPPLEVQFRRTLTFSGGDFTAFFTSPLSATLLAISAFVVALTVWAAVRARRKGVATIIPQEG